MSVNWTAVLVVGVPAYIGAVGGAVAAIIAALNRRALKTPSGPSIGSMVENALHTSLANNYHLRSIGNAVNAPESQAATAEAAKVPDLPESGAP